ncbi:MAG: ABC transporter ATP-binding protein [archaeon]
MPATFIRKVFRVLQYGRPHLRLFTLAFSILVVSSLISVVNPYLMKILIDDVLIGGNMRLFVILICLYVGIFLIGSGISVVMAYASTLLTERITYDVRVELFSHIERLGMSFFNKKKLGDILTRLVVDVAGINDLIEILLTNVLLNIFTGTAILVVCLYLNWKVTLASLLVFPLYVKLQLHYGKKIKVEKRKLRVRSADILGFLQEKLALIKLVQTFIREKYELELYKKKSKSLINMSVKISVISAMAGVMIGFVTFMPMFVIFSLGGYYVIVGIMTLGTLVALMAYIEMLFGPVSTLGTVNIAIQSTMVSVDRVFSFLDTAPEVKERKMAKRLGRVRGWIEFSGVHFAYDQKKPVLRGVDFEINPGEKVLISGPSGEGKSTIVDLLMRFYDPVKGSIKLDGKDLRDLKLASLRKEIGVISQESVLFNTTIRQNILFGKLNATHQEVEEAAKVANIHDFIKSLPHGYDTCVGQRGSNLSGGQKQRISIARTVLKNPDIIVLDEATSSLDKASEKAVYSALEKVTKGKTTIIITHHTSGLRGIDRKLILRNGKVSAAS